MTNTEVIHLQNELEAAVAAIQLAQQAQQAAPETAGGTGGGELADPLGGGDQPVLYYSVRSVPPLGPEPPPLSGPLLEDDPLPIQHDPEGRLLGQVNAVEAGRVHGWACVRGAASAAAAAASGTDGSTAAAAAAAWLTVTVYVDGVYAAQTQASLPTQSATVQRMCQLDGYGGGDGGAGGQLGGGGGGVGFIAPLPPLPQGVHVLRVFVHAPGVPNSSFDGSSDGGSMDGSSGTVGGSGSGAGQYQQELNQSPLLFRESSVSPDLEERVRRKDAIIQTRNAQVAALWDELHTRQPWRNAVGSGKPIRPFPEQEGEQQEQQQQGAGGQQRNSSHLLLFVGVNTGLTSRPRRELLRRTWVPTANGGLQALEERLGVRIRFFVGYSQQRGDVAEKELQQEMQEYGDILRLDVVDEYQELSRKTARLFAHMSDMVHADFYFKIDDDVAVNIDALAVYLTEQRSQGNLYMGCMKSGEVLTDKRWKWYEPEHWRFGDPVGRDNKVNYLRHATGQVYGLSRPVARYIAQNEGILHRYANEDVAVGTWLVGLDIQYDNQRRLCCDTEWKCTSQTSKDNVCLAFSENQCAGLCRSEERLEGIYNDCMRDPYSAGSKGKLPWWGESGWATAAKTGAAAANTTT